MDVHAVGCHARLRITWADGQITEYPWVWVREQSVDRSTFDRATRQRLVAVADIDPAVVGTAASVEGDHIRVEWKDDRPAALVPTALLATLRSGHHDDGPGLAGLVERRPWDRAEIDADWPEVAFGDAMHDDAGVSAVLGRLARDGFCTVTGTPPNAVATRALAERIGYIRETVFGGFWEFRADGSRDDSAYGADALAPHTDATYSADAPGLQVLHCLRHTGDGGASTMVDGYRIADELRAATPDLYDVLATVPVTGRYVGDGVHLEASRPILRHDEDGCLVQVSYNHADRSPFTLPPDEMDRFLAAIRAFESSARDDRLRWERRLPPGTVLLFDNWRVLHGRTAFTGDRLMCGGYLNREDVESRRRTLVGT